MDESLRNLLINLAFTVVFAPVVLWFFGKRQQLGSEDAKDIRHTLGAEVKNLRSAIDARDARIDGQQKEINALVREVATANATALRAEAHAAAAEEKMTGMKALLEQQDEKLTECARVREERDYYRERYRDAAQILNYMFVVDDQSERAKEGKSTDRALLQTAIEGIAKFKAEAHFELPGGAGTPPGVERDLL